MFGETARAGGGDSGLGRLYRWVSGAGYERNVGGAERALRYALGLVLTLAGLAALVRPPLGGVANAALGVVALVTGLYLVYEARVQYCPLNQSVGRRTYREQ